MKEKLQHQAAHFKLEHHKEKKRTRLKGILGLAVALVVLYALLLPAFTLEKPIYCGMEEHTHTEECYAYVLDCPYEKAAEPLDHQENTDPSATDNEKQGDPAASDQTERNPQVATPSDYINIENTVEPSDPAAAENAVEEEHESEVYIIMEETPSDEADAGDAETPVAHASGELSDAAANADAYAVTDSTGNAAAGHVHTAECYRKVLICGEVEHTHTLECYSDADADVETIENIEELFPDFAEGAYQDSYDYFAALAAFQKGYRESGENYQIEVAEDGRESIHGYTRYGDWADDAYTDDWANLYVGFTAEEAGLDITTFDSDTEVWFDNLQEAELYRPIEDYLPVDYESYLTEDEDGSLVLSDAYEADGNPERLIPGDLVILDLGDNEVIREGFIADDDRTDGRTNGTSGKASGSKAASAVDADELDSIPDHIGILTEIDYRKQEMKLMVGDLEHEVQEIRYDLNDLEVLGFARLPETEEAIERNLLVHGEPEELTNPDDPGDEDNEALYADDADLNDAEDLSNRTDDEDLGMEGDGEEIVWYDVDGNPIPRDSNIDGADTDTDETLGIEAGELDGITGNVGDLNVTDPAVADGEPADGALTESALTDPALTDPALTEEELLALAEAQEIVCIDGKLSYRGRDYRIDLSIGEAAHIPATAELRVRELKPGSDAYEQHYRQALEEIEANTPGASNTEADSAEAGGRSEDSIGEGRIDITFARFFDISLMDGDKEIEPEAPVTVSISYDDSAVPTTGIRRAVHFAGDGTTELLEVTDKASASGADDSDNTGKPANFLQSAAQSISTGARKLAKSIGGLFGMSGSTDAADGLDAANITTDSTDNYTITLTESTGIDAAANMATTAATATEAYTYEGSSFTFTQESFSVTGTIVYTVDYEYVNPETGEVYTYSMEGGSTMLLSELLDVLGVTYGVEGTEYQGSDLIAHVNDVTFSNPSLINISQITEKQGGFLGIGAKDVTVDWELKSLKAFNTEESLTLLMDDDQEIIIRVTDAQEIDSFIRNINFYRIDSDGTARKTTEFNDGDNAKVQIDFSIGSGGVTATDRTLVYQLPANIQIASEIDTIARNSSGERVGTFKVTTGGQIELIFDDTYDLSKSFDGELVFNAVVKNTNSGSDQQVKFTDTIGITIKGQEQPKNSDLSIAKSGTLNEDKTKVNYNIQISTRKGSDGTINFSDWLYENGVNIDYDLNNNQSITLTKTDENGNSTSITATVKMDGDSFRLENLPALGANESYSFTYTASVGTVTSENGYASVSNSARAEDTSNGQTATSWQEVATSEISKAAGVESGKVKWTVYVGRAGEDISGFVFSDSMTANGTAISMPDTISVNGTDVSYSGSYTFPSGSTGTATITYYTDYNSTTPEQFHNQAKVVTLGKPDGYTTGMYYTPGQTAPGTSTYGVTKWSPDAYASGDTERSEEEKYIQYKDDGTAVLRWTARIDMPLSGKDLSQITYTDKMTSSNAFGALSGDHYTTAALLKQSLVVWCGAAGTPLVRGVDYDVYDSDGIVVPANSTNTDIMTGFTIRFLSIGKFAEETALSLSYQSIAVLDMNIGETWTFTNRGKIPSGSSTVSWESSKSGELDKQSSISDADGQHRDGGSDTYGSGLVEMDYQDGEIYYRLVLDTKNSDGHYTTDIKVTDVLPEGLEYVDGSFEAWYRQGRDAGHNTNSGRYQKDGNDTADHSLENSSENKNLSVNYDSAARTLTVDIKRASKTYRYIELYYKARINDDEFWSDDSHLKKIYTNTATWGSLRDSESVLVTHEEDTLQKVSSVVNADPDVENSKTTATYQLQINPQGLDLVDHSDTITVIDEMKLSSDTTVAEFIPTSVKVYAYDKEAADKKGALLSTSRYKFTYDSQTDTLEFTLPDELPMVVEYQYEFPVIDSINATNVENTAKIVGVAGATSGNKDVFSAQSGSATAKRKEINLFKVDANDYAKGLPGAKFKLEKFNAFYGSSGAAEGTWETISCKDDSEGLFTADQNGHISIDGTESGYALQNDTLYRITEQVAPENYAKTDKKFYFIWKSDKATDTNEEFRKATLMSSNPAEEGTDRQQVWDIRDQVDYAPESLSYYVPNDYTYIDIQKVWTDNAGNELHDAPVPSSASFTLYRQAKEQDSHTVTVQFKTMNESNNYVNKQNSQTIAVADGSPLTITVDHNSFNGYHVIDSNGLNDTIGENGWGSKGDSNYRPVVIEYDNITSDLTVEIRHGDQFWTPELSGYVTPYEYNVVPGTKEVVQDNIILNSENGYKSTITDADKLGKTYTKDGKTYNCYEVTFVKR